MYCPAGALLHAESFVSAPASIEVPALHAAVTNWLAAGLAQVDTLVSAAAEQTVATNWSDVGSEQVAHMPPRAA
jgi:hypothetical protein